MTIDFKAWPKIPRLMNEQMTITEKIDGTNACVIILPSNPEEEALPEYVKEVFVDGVTYNFATQSRKRVIWPGKTTDNAGFAAWAWDNAEELIRALGFGYHYGEWYGRGIQRGYGLMEKRFALFNPWRYEDNELAVPQLELVPVIYSGAVHKVAIDDALTVLREFGSVAVKGEKAEGVIVQHKLSGATYKAFVHDDGVPKSLKV